MAHAHGGGGFSVVGQFVLNSAAAKEVLLLSRKTVSEIGDAVVREAKARVPVDTGHLQASIQKEDRTSGTIVFTSTRTSRSSLGYGGFVEIGTARSPAQPYLRPALEIVRGNISRGSIA